MYTNGISQSVASEPHSREGVSREVEERPWVFSHNLATCNEDSNRGMTSEDVTE
jgi:hypothetical protein